jgi:DNA-binding transcriptional ArsR family regulator
MASKQKTPSKRPARRSKAAPTDEVIKAMSHPIRFQALSILNERTASAKEIAEEVGETIGAVAYHIRVLADLGAIELVETKQRRGAIESFYRATMRSFFTDAESSKLPARTRRQLSAPIVQRIVDDALTALPRGGFDDESSHSSWTALDLDDQGYQDAGAVLAGALERLIEIQAESADRASGGDDARKRYEAAVLFFEPTPRGAARTPRPRRAAAKAGANGRTANGRR